MSGEQQTCQNCKTEFRIEPEDFAFYEKIKVPPPTFCPECRLIRRMTWRNESNLYRRLCAAPGHSEEIISLYSREKSLTIYDQKYWWSDEWDPFTYGREYDFSVPFFIQFDSLARQVPTTTLDNNFSTNVNCDYCNDSWESKNCYLCITAGYSEDSCYSKLALYSKNIFDSLWAVSTQYAYECIDAKKCYRIFFSQNVENCMDSFFLFDCRDCTNCFGCVGLRHKQYHIFNVPYTPEEYERKIKELWDGGYSALKKLREEFIAFSLLYPRRYSHITNGQNVIGDNVRNARNCYVCFDIEDGAENSKYLAQGGLGMKDCYDLYNSGERAELCYEDAVAGTDVKNILFSRLTLTSYNIFYSSDIVNSHDLFGCIGLRHKSYCIFNKQYTKEEYEKLVPKIIAHMNVMPYMDKKGIVYRYGEFFPPELSPFAYNESAAQDFFPLTKEEVFKHGYAWSDPESKSYEITISADKLSDTIKDIPDTICKEVIGCMHKGTCGERCSMAFRVIPQELTFYQKMNLPLPRLCPNCRHAQRIAQRNPFKLWHRKCQCTGSKSENGVYANQISHAHGLVPCLNIFQTSYAPNRPEIIYCERCYQAEII